MVNAKAIAAPASEAMASARQRGEMGRIGPSGRAESRTAPMRISAPTPASSWRTTQPSKTGAGHPAVIRCTMIAISELGTSAVVTVRPQWRSDRPMEPICISPFTSAASIRMTNGP
jgi:hypothetical protein